MTTAPSRPDAPPPVTASGPRDDATDPVAATRARLEDAVAAAPGDAGHRRRLVRFLLERRDPRAALPHLAALVALRADDPNGHGLLGTVHETLGDHDAAAACYRRVLALRGNDPEALHRLAGVLLRTGAVEEALELAERACAAAPARAAAHATRAVALVRAERYRDAEAAARAALDRDPRLVPAWVNLGTARRLQGDNAGAVEAADRAVALAPGLAEARVNRALALLTLGDFDRAWTDYAWIWRAPDARRPPLALPDWDGRTAPGRVLAWGDQGVGDQLWAAGFLRPGTFGTQAFALAVDHRLVALLARSFPNVPVVALDAPRAAFADDLVAAVPLMRLPSLAWARHRRPGALPGAHLVPDPARVAALRERYRGAAAGRRVVGIAWRSRRPDGRVIEAPLAAWRPLLTRTDLFFLDLQYGSDDADREAVRRGMRVYLHRDFDVDPWSDLDGLAAQTAAVDRLVTVVNLMVPLGPAVGTRTVVAVRPQESDWRYSPGAGRSLWYPEARLVPQADPADWESVFRTIARRL